MVICTHNPREDYLRRTIGALRAQTMPLDCWEFLLIDNASAVPLAAKWDLAWHPQGRHVREMEVGLTAARLRGIREARGELLVFVDDDNLLCPDYLMVADRIKSAIPFLGVWGAGRLEPEFETQPALNLAPQLPLLALRSVSAILWSNNTGDYEVTPWGAGLCVKRRVAEHYQKLVEQLNMTQLLDRRGQALFCGGDDLFSWASVAMGYGFGLIPCLHITHLISSGRLKPEYFVRLIHDHAFSHGILKYLLTGRSPKSIGLFRYGHLVLHGLRNGLFSAQCQWAESRGESLAAKFIAEKALHPLTWTHAAGASSPALISWPLDPDALHGL